MEDFFVQAIAFVTAIGALVTFIIKNHHKSLQIVELQEKLGDPVAKEKAVVELAKTKVELAQKTLELEKAQEALRHIEIPTPAEIAKYGVSANSDVKDFGEDLIPESISNAYTDESISIEDLDDEEEAREILKKIRPRYVLNYAREIREASRIYGL